MHARRDDPAIPAWSFDRLDSSQPPELDPPYFDTSLGAWVLSRHADVLAAFRASSLAFITSNGVLAELQTITQKIDVGSNADSFRTQYATVMFVKPDGTPIASGCAAAVGKRFE